MKTFRNLLALFLTLSLVISMIPGVFAGAERDSAKEYIPVDPYVYNYGIKENSPHRYQYFSPYYAQHNYNNGEKQGRDQIFLYTIYNSVTGEVIPAYCTDILVQSAAVSAAMNAFNKELLANHIRTCVVHELQSGNEEVVDELVATLQKLMK